MKNLSNDLTSSASHQTRPSNWLKVLIPNSRSYLNLRYIFTSDCCVFKFRLIIFYRCPCSRCTFDGQVSQEADRPENFSLSKYLHFLKFSTKLLSYFGWLFSHLSSPESVFDSKCRIATSPISMLGSNSFWSIHRTRIGKNLGTDRPSHP